MHLQGWQYRDAVGNFAPVSLSIHPGAPSGGPGGVQILGSGDRQYTGLDKKHRSSLQEGPELPLLSEEVEVVQHLLDDADDVLRVCCGKRYPFGCGVLGQQVKDGGHQQTSETHLEGQ